MSRDDFYIAVDFDGTIVMHEYPEVGKPVPGALEKLREFNKRGVKIILWTMRGGANLFEAVEYLNEAGIDIWGVNKNPEQDTWTCSPKAYAQIYIDDAAWGCPLVYPEKGRPYVDWSKIDI